MDEDAKYMTLLVTDHGLFRYKQMPFGLKNASAAFQRATDEILATEKFQYALVHLKDVFVLSQTPSQHIEEVATVLRLMKCVGFTLNLKKSFFFTDAINYLRHRIPPKHWRSRLRRRTPYMPSNHREISMNHVSFSFCVMFTVDLFLFSQG